MPHTVATGRINTAIRTSSAFLPQLLVVCRGPRPSGRASPPRRRSSPCRLGERENERGPSSARSRGAELLHSLGEPKSHPSSAPSPKALGLRFEVRDRASSGSRHPDPLTFDPWPAAVCAPPPEPFRDPARALHPATLGSLFERRQGPVGLPHPTDLVSLAPARVARPSANLRDGAMP